MDISNDNEGNGSVDWEDSLTEPEEKDFDTFTIDFFTLFMQICTRNNTGNHFLKSFIYEAMKTDMGLFTKFACFFKVAPYVKLVDKKKDSIDRIMQVKVSNWLVSLKNLSQKNEIESTDKEDLELMINDFNEYQIINSFAQKLGKMSFPYFIDNDIQDVEETEYDDDGREDEKLFLKFCKEFENTLDTSKYIGTNTYISMEKEYSEIMAILSKINNELSYLG